jgi:hypothetical protein
MLCTLSAKREASVGVDRRGVDSDALEKSKETTPAQAQTPPRHTIIEKVTRKRGPVCAHLAEVVDEIPGLNQGGSVPFKDGAERIRQCMSHIIQLSLENGLSCFPAHLCDVWAATTQKRVARGTAHSL